MTEEDTASGDRLRGLIERPSESLNVELKRWIDPSEPAGIAKIVKASLALRNRNGGDLVLGLDNATMLPHAEGAPVDVKVSFHVDKIQGLISRYASTIFEVTVSFVEKENLFHPVISIPSGIRTPVFVKADLVHEGNRILRIGDLYVRTLHANGTPSTALAKPSDWSEILEICFDNREADIGRFLRRQLSGVDLSALLALLGQAGSSAVAMVPQAPTPSETEVSLRQQTMDFLADGERRFREALLTAEHGGNEATIDNVGAWSVALVIAPQRQDMLPDRTFRTIIRSANPDYTGWPVWIDSTDFNDAASRPYVTEGGVQALIKPVEGRLEFQRIEPTGRFYQWRTLQDDETNKVEPGTALDPILVILRTAESIMVGLAFAKALGWHSESSTLGFAFQWSGLRGRTLKAWADRPYFVRAWGAARDATVTSGLLPVRKTPS